MNPSVGIQTVEVDSSTIYGARQMVQQIYDPQQINKIERVSDWGNSSSDPDSEISTEGLGAIIVFAFLVWLFAVATPFVTMFLFGGIATKISEVIAGDSLEIALEESIRTKKNDVVLFILITAIISGGIGFFTGDQIKKNYFSNSTQSFTIRNNETKN